MQYFQLNPCPILDLQLCILRDYPEGLGPESYRFTMGEAFGDELPRRCKVYMSKKERGVKLASVVSNTCNVLIVHRSLKEIIEATNKGPTEYIELHIYNHKKRPASDEYFIVHPVGAWDCLDLKKSNIKWMGEKIVNVRKPVLDPKKLDGVPDLFRVKERPSILIISKNLVDKIRESDFEVTNFEATPVAGSS